MTKNEFTALCEQYTVAPAIALENDDLCAALTAKDSAEVERILREEF
jgi:hypothetical protein